MNIYYACGNCGCVFVSYNELTGHFTNAECSSVKCELLNEEDRKKKIRENVLKIGDCITIQKHIRGYLCRFSNKNKEKILMNTEKNEIIRIWGENVKGKQLDTSSKTKNHCGKEGHCLEEAMGIKPNGKNEPDLLGYEMKKESNKISFGDWSAEEYLFTKDKKITSKMYQNELKKYGLKTTGSKKILKERFENYCNENNIEYNHPSSREKLKKLNHGKDINITRKQFIEIFGTQNEKKNNRYSWSGKCFPNVYNYNDFGQKIFINYNNDIIIKYCYKYDKRKNKGILSTLRIEEDETLSISIWSKTWLQKKVEDKFNMKGFFICKKNGSIYNKICFGPPFNYSYFIEQFKNGKIILDSGMYQGNGRNYSQFRADNKFWNTLINEEY